MSTAKGCEDLFGADLERISYLRNLAAKIFAKFNAEPLETPVFERSEYLPQTQSETTKLVYNIDNRDVFKESLTLRYDQTMPLVRFLIGNQRTFGTYSQIGRVYRRDAPSGTRKREFWQADLDVVGNSQKPIQSEKTFRMFLLMLAMFLRDLQWKDTLQGPVLLVNDLSMDLDLPLTPQQKIELYRFMDKRDDFSREEYAKLWSQLKQEQSLDFDFEDLEKATEKKDELLKRKFGQLAENSLVVFSSWMVRGLDYYNGIIFELQKQGISIAGGGQYDGLDARVSKRKPQLQMMGISLGLSRIVSMISLPVSPRKGAYVWSKDWQIAVEAYEKYERVYVDTETNSEWKAYGKAVKSGFSVFVTDNGTREIN